ncbi:MAG: AAA-like domain-containing protein [Bacteroidota bacterium]
MEKIFNTAGTCYPQLHYMMDNSQKVEASLRLIERGAYFTINRPRQYGKTTLLYTLSQVLNETEDYFAIPLNFQGIDRKWHESDTAFGQMFVEQMETILEVTDQDLHEFLVANKQLDSLDQISKTITKLVVKSNRKLVLLIDEVDASSNYAAFVNFLGMLRKKFLSRMQLPTFQSVILAGVHDIKNLKFKLRNPDEANYNSPWNIAVDFGVRMSFNAQEIAPMLEEYSQSEGVQMNVSAVAEKLYYYTSGYPFLVSRICQIIAEKLLPNKTESKRFQWTLEDVEEAVQYLLNESNTNFESLIKNLGNHKDLYDLTYQIVMEGVHVGFNSGNETISKGVLYGIFKSNGKVRVQNRIYEQYIYNYLASKLETSTVATYVSPPQFQQEDGSLNLELVLERFQQFIKEEYSDRDEKFLERQWRLIFLAFLRPIVNGEGYTFKEVQVSQEKRLDIVVTYKQHRYVIELKKWYGEQYHRKGLEQLSAYLDIHALDDGFLVIFDPKKEQSFKKESIEHREKSIFAVWI